MSIKCKDITNVIEKLCPVKYAYEWDNIGLLIGDTDKEINKIVVALDATEKVVDEAIEQKVDLIITHHPMIFKGLKKITYDSFIGRKVIKLIENGTCLYAMHTNFDISGSLSIHLANIIGLKNQVDLEVVNKEKLYKLVVFTPESHANQVRETICNCGGGFIGNYSHCTYNLNGEGTFKPLDGTNPFIGEIGNIKKVKEVRIETIVSEDNKDKVVKNMLKVHPYEEVAYDVYLLNQTGKHIGIGRVGYLDESKELKKFAQEVKENLNLESLRVYGDFNKKVYKVAVSPGSGRTYIKQALRHNVDVLITGDIDYHTGVDAVQEGLSLIDAGHYGTEHIMVDYTIDYLKEHLEKHNIDLIKAEESSPFKTLL